MLGEVAVLGRLEEAVQGAAMVIEAVVEDLQVTPPPSCRQLKALCRQLRVWIFFLEFQSVESE